MPLNPTWDTATVKEQALEDIKNGTSILLPFADLAVRLPGWTVEEHIEPEIDADVNRADNLDDVGSEDEDIPTAGTHVDTDTNVSGLATPSHADADVPSAHAGTANDTDIDIDTIPHPPTNPLSNDEDEHEQLSELEAFCQIFTQRRRGGNSRRRGSPPTTTTAITTNVTVHANATVNVNANARVNTANDKETQTHAPNNNHEFGHRYYDSLASYADLGENLNDGLGEIIEPDEMYNDVDSMDDLEDLESVISSVDSWEVISHDRGDDGDNDEEGESYDDLDSPDLVPMIFIVPAVEDEETGEGYRGELLG